MAAMALTGCGGGGSGSHAATSAASTSSAKPSIVSSGATTTTQQAPLAANPTLDQLRAAVNASGGDCSDASWRKVSAENIPAEFTDLAWCEKGTLAIATVGDEFGGQGFLAMRKLAREKAAADGVALSVEAGDGWVIAGTKTKLNELRPTFSESVIG